MIIAYLKRTLKRPLFLFSIIGVCGVCLLRFIDALTSSVVVADLHLLIEIDSFRKIITVFSVLPAVSIFVDEWTTNTSFSCIIRCGSPSKYAWSQVIVCFFTTFLTTMLGFIMFLICDCFRTQLNIDNGLWAEPPFGSLPPWLHMLAISAVFSLSCAMWSISGLLLSSIFPDKLVAIAAPFILSYLLERISMQFPEPINLLGVALSHISIMDSPILSFLYALSLFLFISVVFGAAFAFIVEKRIKGELG